MNRKKLNDYFPDWSDGYGIFSLLTEYNPPWVEDIGDNDAMLDLAYHGGYSGAKIASPYLTRTIAGDVPTISEYARICLTLKSLFMPNWAKQYATLSAQYDPIENYSMREQMTNDTTEDTFGHVNTREYDTDHGKTGTETTTNTGTDTVTYDTEEERTPNLTHAKTGTETTAPLVTMTEQENTFGFNTVAENGEPTTKKTQTSGGTSTLTYNTTDKDTGTDTNTKTGTEETEHDTETQTTFNTSDTDTGTVTDTESGKNTRKRNYVLTRAGNIGTVTAQDMVEQEHNLWVWNFFRDVVFPDLDYLLTIPVY